MVSLLPFAKHRASIYTDRQRIIWIESLSFCQDLQLTWNHLLLMEFLFCLPIKDSGLCRLSCPSLLMLITYMIISSMIIICILVYAS